MEKLPRLDTDNELKKRILPHCRLKEGEIWQDPEGLHRVGVGDAGNPDFLDRLFKGRRIGTMLNDPPYNIAVGRRPTAALSRKSADEYVEFTRRWLDASLSFLDKDAHFYLWLGADQNDGFQPLPEIMILLREYGDLRSRSFISMRNQRGYGTQQNWMSLRQELLYYVKGKPEFKVVYTDIPKILKGYYKTVGGRRQENLERSRSDCIRPGNIWVDMQQVFYRMEENVPGAYAQKPLASAERILTASPPPGNSVVADLFSHSGTTLLAAEKAQLPCCTMDIDPVYAELSIRRIERFRSTAKTGWQWENPFPEIDMESTERL
ncbi:site-specific DNA-methyltransferase [Marispirochaeta aestuarii]|uniref:site-specific DNA-methyltransferase (adenine-specific) n=1 Tax=Marispirochaeta aestuarii TaxID=1963862 RepID=A0A1Y1RWF6_9SPIO|nr:site-specific DNA-methyltransferase [Marispirochaeta aestuarii]ORC33932.1 site-specific DNA-methyltransferase [Marispirochaeta aestuarii]